MVFIGLISTSLQPLSPTSWLPSTPQPFPCRVSAKRVVVAVPKKSLVTIILVRSPSNFIFTQFGCLLTAPKRKKLKIPNFIFLTKWGVVPCWWTCGFAWWLWFPSKNHHGSPFLIWGAFDSGTGVRACAFLHSSGETLALSTQGSKNRPPSGHLRLKNPVWRVKHSF